MCIRHGSANEHHQGTTNEPEEVRRIDGQRPTRDADRRKKCVCTLAPTRETEPATGPSTQGQSVMTKLGTAAQFGGADAATMCLPHFRALKSAAGSVMVDGMGDWLLAVVLRVDGAVEQYDVQGLDHMLVTQRSRQIEFDIGIDRSSWSKLDGGAADPIRCALSQIPGSLEELEANPPQTIEFGRLATSLKAISEAYASIVSDPDFARGPFQQNQRPPTR